jgi:predicted alpha/beta superfamily hydrolase
MTLTRNLPLILIVFASLTASAQEWPGIKDSVYSNAIGEMRKIQVILPKDYKQGSGTTYEVLYMPDGEWYMEQVPFIYNFVVNSHYAPANIFVLIPNTYRNGRNIRDRDYSPVRIPEDSITGGADNYHKFLKDELIPYVEKKYPANGQRTLVGSSFSGLFAIYAYFKDPMLFNSYVASDPNLSFGDNYVPKLATEKLPGFDKVTSTLFFAGLKISSRGMGSYTLDSIMKRSAPAQLLWKYIEYADETHYSVQHKAFYDGLRYAHFGYAEQPATIHPMGGVLATGKAIQIAIMGNPVNVRYTTDGSKPTPESPLLEMGIQIPGPGMVKIQSFPNRLSDARSEELTFKAPSIALKKSAAKTASLTYELYDGSWSSFPDIKK